MASRKWKTGSKNFLLLTSYFLLVFLSGCATSTVEHEKEADFYYKMGISYINEGDIQMAFVQLQKAIQLDPDNKYVLNSLGLVYLHFEEFDKAKGLFLRAISLDPEFSEAYNNAGVAYMRTGQWQEAIEAFKKALSNPLYETPERGFYNLGKAYYRVGQFEQAINAFKDSMKRSPLFTLSYYGLALVYNKAGRYGDAATVLSKAIDMDSTYRGDKARFTEDIQQKALTVKGDDEADFRDYLEIMKY